MKNCKKGEVNLIHIQFDTKSCLSQVEDSTPTRKMGKVDEQTIYRKIQNPTKNTYDRIKETQIKNS